MVMSVSGPGCPSRKSGTFCVCPLCVTSHLHSSRGGGSGAIPLLKSQFPPGGEAQYCPRMSHAQHQQQQSSVPAAAAALGHPAHHAPVCTATTYSVSDPRRFHCLGMGRSAWPGVHVALQRAGGPGCEWGFWTGGGCPSSELRCPAGGDRLERAPSFPGGSGMGWTPGGKSRCVFVWWAILRSQLKRRRVSRAGVGEQVNVRLSVHTHLKRRSPRGVMREISRGGGNRCFEKGDRDR
ncbi:GS homeobox 2 [Chelydra serpentina]|uniref:GS homeobox 2 n=1 Tax=Chelydra serpentina TaxID=8475 RepID=A0A8T1SE36_CHESE|nr:GS homeobox 2 [Chelydra serpentina]